MRRMKRLSAVVPGNVWTTRLRCVKCRGEVIHLEMSPVDDDEPLGPPLEFLLCECGGLRGKVLEP